MAETSAAQGADDEAHDSADEDPQALKEEPTILHEVAHSMFLSHSLTRASVGILHVFARLRTLPHPSYVTNLPQSANVSYPRNRPCS